MCLLFNSLTDYLHNLTIQEAIPNIAPTTCRVIVKMIVTAKWWLGNVMPFRSKALN